MRCVNIYSKDSVCVWYQQVVEFNKKYMRARVEELIKILAGFDSAFSWSDADEALGSAFCHPLLYCSHSYYMQSLCQHMRCSVL